MLLEVVGDIDRQDFRPQVAIIASSITSGLPVSVFLFLISDCNLRAEEEGCLVVMLLHRHRTRVVTCEVCIVILVDVEDGEVDINLSAHQVHPGVASECGSSPFFASSIVSINFIFLMIV